MERFTKRDEQGVSFIGDYGEPPYPVISEAALEMLAYYEETGMVPFEIRVVKKILGDISLERFEEIAQAEAEGRLVMLPCKVGDTVYFIDADEVNAWIDEYKVKWFYCSSRGVNRVYSVCGTLAKNFRPKDFGKTVFLTREEAEKALEGMK